MPNPTGGRILVVEDDGPIRTLISKLLSRHGYEVETAENGEMAIAQLGIGHYDVIILDLMMPVTDGRQVLEWIVDEQPHHAKSCILVVTATARYENEQVFAVLRKPFEIVDLVATV